VTRVRQTPAPREETGPGIPGALCLMAVGWSVVRDKPRQAEHDEEHGDEDNGQTR
jgi:hypothetical protein